MLKGRYISLLTVFSLVSLVGTGFSSWVISGVSPASVTGNISVSDSSDINSLISIDTSEHANGFTCFSYCSEGFVENSQIVETGALTYYFVLNTSEAIKLGYLTSKTTIEAILSLNGNTKFNNSKSTLNSVSLKLSGANNYKITNYNYDNNADSINESIRTTIEISSFSSSSQTSKMSITYNFNLSFFDIVNGVDGNNKPSFNLKLNMIKE